MEEGGGPNSEGLECYPLSTSAQILLEFWFCPRGDAFLDVQHRLPSPVCVVENTRVATHINRRDLICACPVCNWLGLLHHKLFLAFTRMEALIIRAEKISWHPGIGDLFPSSPTDSIYAPTASETSFLLHPPPNHTLPASEVFTQLLAVSCSAAQHYQLKVTRRLLWAECRLA